MVHFSNQRFYPHFISRVLKITVRFHGNNSVHSNTGQSSCTTVLTGWVSLISLSRSKWYFSILCIGTESTSRNLNLPLLASFWHLYNNKQLHVSCNIPYATFPIPDVNNFAQTCLKCMTKAIFQQWNKLHAWCCSMQQFITSRIASINS
jgi:hypothetical protein